MQDLRCRNCGWPLAREAIVEGDLATKCCRCGAMNCVAVRRSQPAGTGAAAREPHARAPLSAFRICSMGAPAPLRSSILPWVGGKFRLVPLLIDRIEAISHQPYGEPFLGMGDVFLRR